MALCLSPLGKTAPQALSPAVDTSDFSKWPGIIIRRTFLEVAPVDMGQQRDELQKSRSCGDLPSISFRKDLPERSNLGFVDGEKINDNDATFTEDTVTPTSSKDCSDDGDSNSTTSASGSLTEASLLLHLSAPNVDLGHAGSGSPSFTGSKVTPAMRRRMRRRRAAEGKEKNQIIMPEHLNGEQASEDAGRSRQPSSADFSSYPASASGSSSRSSRAPSGDLEKEKEEGREVWLQQLWAGVSNADEILEATYSFIDYLSLLNIVDILHAVGKCVESEYQAVSLRTDKRLLALLSRLQNRAQGLHKGRVISRAIWGLGKVGAMGEDVMHLLAKLSDNLAASPGLLESCSSQELSNTLWGLARLGSTDPRSRCHAERLALRIVAVSGRRLPELTPQCLANSLWAIGKLGIRGQSIAAFAGNCLQEMCHQRQLTGFSAQGLANSLWACARLQLQAEVVPAFCVAVARQVSEERLQDFLPQELSMTIWAVAKITGRGSRCSGGSSSRQHRRQKAPLDVENFVLAATKEATRRLNEFSPQGLSNIGWAVATMELTREDRVHAFLVATAAKAMPELNSYPPQAIANLCWALCRLSNASEDLSVHFFASAVAVQAEERMDEFEWQDLAGIVSAMNRAELAHLPQVHSFATALIWRATETSCGSIGTQALLNMALSAARLGVEPDVLLPLAEHIDAIFVREGGTDGLNDIDRRQWSQVKLHCSSQPCWYEDSTHGSSWSDAAALVNSYNKFDSAFGQPCGFSDHTPTMDAVPEGMPMGAVQVWMPSSMVWG